MSNPSVPSASPHHTLGTDWANFVTAKDHAAVMDPYYCEIHLRVDLSESAYNELNTEMGNPAATPAERDGRLARIKALLKAEIRRNRRDNPSTYAIVDALMLR